MTTADPLRDYEDAQDRLSAAKLAGDAGEIVAAAGAFEDAKGQLGLFFALLLRCALDGPTRDAHAFALSLAPVVGEALAGQVEWQRRKINELLKDVDDLGRWCRELEDRLDAMTRETERADGRSGRPRQEGRDGHPAGAAGGGAGRDAG